MLKEVFVLFDVLHHDADIDIRPRTDFLPTSPTQTMNREHAPRRRFLNNLLIKALHRLPNDSPTIPHDRPAVRERSRANPSIVVRQSVA